MNNKRITKPLELLNKHNKIIGGIAAALWVFSTIAAFKTITTPLMNKKNVVDNKVTSTVEFQYTANVRQSIIYRNPTLVNPEGNIFLKLLDTIVVRVDSKLSSQKPLSGEVQSKVSLYLSAEEFPMEIELLPKDISYKSTLGSGNEISLIMDEITINFKENIQGYLNQIEKEIGYMPSKYNIKLKTEIVESSAAFEGNKVALNDSSELNFEYSNGQIKRVGERSFKKENRVNSITIVPNQLSFSGFIVSILKARYIFVSLWLVLTAAGVHIIRAMLRKNKVEASEAENINKRYKSRLIDIKQAIKSENKTSLLLKSMKSLINLAEDKDLPLLKFEEEQNVIYYAADGDCIYSYAASKIVLLKPEIVTTIRVGSEIVNEK